VQAVVAVVLKKQAAHRELAELVEVEQVKKMQLMEQQELLTQAVVVVVLVEMLALQHLLAAMEVAAWSFLNTQMHIQLHSQAELPNQLQQQGVIK
jgi:hypothetical protein